MSSHLKGCRRSRAAVNLFPSQSPTPTPANIRAGMVKAFGERSMRQLEAKGLVNIVATEEDLAAGVRIGPTGKAVFVGDRAYFIANRMEGATAHVELLHEIGEHYGLARMLGADGYEALKQRVKELALAGDPHPTAAWAFVKDNYPELQEGGDLFMHEVLAQLGQRAGIEQQSWFQQAVASIKRFLVKMGFTGMIKVSDIQDMVRHALTMAADGTLPPKGGIRSKAGDLVMAAKAAILTRSVDIHSASFKNWFGDWENGSQRSDVRQGRLDGKNEGNQNNGGDASLVQGNSGLPGTGLVNRDGTPAIFFHGTSDDVTSFDLNHPNRKDFGWLGRGAYATDSNFAADSYSLLKRGSAEPNVMPVYVAVKNPYITGPAVKQQTRWYTQTEIDQITDQLKSLGHDGVVVEYPDGALEVVAFNPGDVKSAISNTGEFDQDNHNIMESRPGIRDPKSERINPDRIAFAHQFLQELAAEGDGVFRYPVSSKSSIDEVFADVFPDADYVGDATREDERRESFSDHRFLFRTPATGGRVARDFYVHTTDDGRVWINVSDLRPGMEGSRIYQAVANYAYNTKKRFVGDPLKLTEDAIIRRTVNMLASALRFGTVEHLEPAYQQLEGVPENGVLPLAWKGNDIDKIRSLIHTFIGTMQNQFPKIKGYYYDFAKQGFFDRHGQPVDVVRFGRARNKSLAGEARAGEATLREAILIQSLISPESGGVGDGGILQAVLDGADRLTTDGHLGAMFSKGSYVLIYTRHHSRIGFEIGEIEINEIKFDKEDWLKRVLATKTTTELQDVMQELRNIPESDLSIETAHPQSSIKFLQQLADDDVATSVIFQSTAATTRFPTAPR